MSDVEDDPYAVSSDSDDDEQKSKKPPPKINIEGRTTTDLKQIKESLTSENKELIKDEKTLEEIADLKRTKGQELSKFKKDFEQGTVVNADPETVAAAKEVEKPAGLDKQTLSAFKNKFEKMDETLEQNLEERLRTLDKSLEGVGKDNLKSMKGVFENPSAEFVAEKSDDLLQELQNRSEADKRRVHAAFQSEKEEEPKNCCICDKIVYPVEKVLASKKLYHTQCFKCSKCGKKLGPTTFNSHQGTLYCKTHLLEVLHPERAGTFGAAEDEDDETIHVDDDDEYAVTSKPKQLGADVVRAGNANIEDELSAIKSTLKEKKESWQTSVNEAAQSGEKRTALDEIESGKVKANLDK